MATATEKGIRVDLSDKKAGLAFARQNEQEARKSLGVNSAEAGRGQNSGKAPETRKVKNQAEIERVKKTNERRRAENEQIEKRRESIAEAVEGALDMVTKKLSDRSLPEKERARLLWVSRSVKGAREKMERGKYTVEVKQGEKVVDSRPEGLLLEGLIAETGREIERVQGYIKHIERIQKLKSQAETNNPDEDSKKKQWHKILEELPNTKLKKRIIARMESWKEIDEARGEIYDQAKIEAQLGEACYQVIKEYTTDQIDRLKKLGGEKSRQIERYEKILNTMAGASENYFQQHYQKLSGQLNQADKQKQDLYTRREANLISKDSDFREMLLEDFKEELPKGFDKMDKEQQDYELAMLAVDNRVLLNMPRRKKLLEEPAPVYEQGQSPAPGAPLNRHSPALSPDSPRGVPSPSREGAPALVPKDGVKAIKPTSPEKFDRIEIKDAMLIDVSEIVRRMALTKAEERLRAEMVKIDMSGTGPLSKFKNKIKLGWAGLTEKAKRTQYFKEALNEIQSDNNLMKAIQSRAAGVATPNIGRNYEILDAAVKEFQGEVTTQKEIGEKISEDPNVKAQVAELLYRHAHNKWADLSGLDPKFASVTGREAIDLFVKNRIAELFKGSQFSDNKDFAKKAEKDLFASNFAEIAEKYKEYVKSETQKIVGIEGKENEKAILQHLQGMMSIDLQLGLKERDLANNKPEGTLRLYEKALDWAEGRKYLGKIIANPLVGSVIGSLSAEMAVGAGARWAVVGGARAFGYANFWVPLGAGAMIGGTMRYIKRSKDIKYDLAQELRHEALGGKGSEILDKAGRYDTMKFAHAQASIEALQNKENLTDADKQRLAEVLSRLQMREAVGAERRFRQQLTRGNVDLFTLNAEEGIKYGSTLVAESDLKLALADVMQKHGLTEQGLEQLTLPQRQALIEMMNKVDSKQDWFRRSEAAKSAVKGAVMGAATGLLGQKLAYVGGKWIGRATEKLLGHNYLSYFETHNANIDKIWDSAKGSHFYQSHFGGSGAAGHLAGVPRFLTGREYMASLKGNIAGGDVQTVHTQNWYDNPGHFDPDSGLYIPDAGSHAHQLNELRFHISKDPSGDFHFKVPVKNGDSWLTHPEWKIADVDKAFSEGHIKMIFVPDGASPHEGIVLDVGPNHEVIIPHDSNLKDLFDPTTGRPKGNGFFGLAEQTGTRPDGSHNYIWISSDRGNGNMDFSKVVDMVSTPEAPKDYDSAIALVQPERKVYLRPEERAAKEAAKNKKQKEKAFKKAVKEAKKKKPQVHGEGNVPSPENVTENKDAKLRKDNPDAFDKAKVNKLANVFQWDLQKSERLASGVDLKIIKAYWDEEEKATSKATAEAAKPAPAATEQKLAVPAKKELAVVHEGGPSTEEYLQEINKLQEAVKKAEDRYEKITDIDKRIRQLESGTDLLDDDIDDLHEDFKKLTGDDWSKKFNPAAHRKSDREKKRPFIKDVAEDTKETKAAPVKDGSKKPETTRKPQPEAADQNQENAAAKLMESLIEKTGHKVHFDMDGELMPDVDKVKVLKALDGALDAKDKVLRKLNRKHRGTELEKGIILGFPASADRIHFDGQDRLIIPPNASAQEVKLFLEADYKKTQERIKARKDRSATKAA